VPRLYNEDQLHYEKVKKESTGRQPVERCRCEKLVAEARDSLGKQSKGNVRCWKLLPSSTVKTVTENISPYVIVILKL
jgi:hypothetical protein